MKPNKPLGVLVHRLAPLILLLSCNRVMGSNSPASRGPSQLANQPGASHDPDLKTRPVPDGSAGYMPGRDDSIDANARGSLMPLGQKIWTLCVHLGATRGCQETDSLTAVHRDIEARLGRVDRTHGASNQARVIASYEAILADLVERDLYLARTAEMLLKRLAERHVARGAYRQAEDAWSRFSDYSAARLNIHILTPFAVRLAWEYHKLGHHRRAASLWHWPVLIVTSDGEMMRTEVSDRRGTRPIAVAVAVTPYFESDGPDHRLMKFVTALNFGWLSLAYGEHHRAAEQFVTARQLADAVDEPILASALADAALATVHTHHGQTERARTNLDLALRSIAGQYGPDSPHALPIMVALANLSPHPTKTPAGQKVRSWLTRTRPAIAEFDAGDLLSLEFIADTYRSWGDDQQALPLYRQAHDWHSRQDAGDPLAAAALAQKIGLVFAARGQLPWARDALRQAVVRLRQRVPVNQFALAEARGHLAVVNGKLKRPGEAVSAWQKAAETLIADAHGPLSSLPLAQIDRPQFHRFDRLDQNISFHQHFATHDGQATAFAMDQLINRKGRTIDTLIHRYRWLRNSKKGAHRRRFARLEALSKQLSRAVYSNEPQAVLERISRELTDTERQLAYYLPRLADVERTVSLADVVRTLPEHTALVEYVLYRPYFGPAASRPGALRYAAYVVDDGGRAASFDLGDATVINKAVFTLRAALSSPERGHVKAIARALDAIVMQPVRAHVGDIDTLYVAPDGALAIIPMQALVSERERYVLEDWLVVYVNSARDLLRSRSEKPGSGAVILADPRFDEPATGPVEKRPIHGMRPGLPMLFPPLRAAATEARDIAALLSESGLDARMLTGSAARETELEAVRSPEILHIATHGFFLNGQNPDVRGRRAVVLTEESPAAIMDTPLLRSGLALTGANIGGPDPSNDGIMTAMEASSLHLDGTRLVVLSACDTGLGTLSIRDGVYGLQRALIIAGAETIVASLWRVSDRATKDLMVGYYRQLLAGHGRAESLRRVQMAFLRDERRAHPFYWAPFVVTGDPRPLREATQTSWFTGKRRPLDESIGDGLILDMRVGPNGGASGGPGGSDSPQNMTALLGAALSLRRGQNYLGVNADAALLRYAPSLAAQAFLGVHLGHNPRIPSWSVVQPGIELELGAHWFSKLTSTDTIYRERPSVSPYVGLRAGISGYLGNSWDIGLWLNARYDLWDLQVLNVAGDNRVEAFRLGGLNMGIQLSVHRKLL